MELKQKVKQAIEKRKGQDLIRSVSEIKKETGCSDKDILQVTGWTEIEGDCCSGKVNNG